MGKDVIAGIGGIVAEDAGHEGILDFEGILLVRGDAGGDFAIGGAVATDEDGLGEAERIGGDGERDEVEFGEEIFGEADGSDVSIILEKAQFADGEGAIARLEDGGNLFRGDAVGEGRFGGGEESVGGLVDGDEDGGDGSGALALAEEAGLGPLESEREAVIGELGVDGIHGDRLGLFDLLFKVGGGLGQLGDPGGEVFGTLGGPLGIEAGAFDLGLGGG